MPDPSGATLSQASSRAKASPLDADLSRLMASFYPGPTAHVAWPQARDESLVESAPAGGPDSADSDTEMRCRGNVTKPANRNGAEGELAGEDSVPGRAADESPMPAFIPILDDVDIAPMQTIEGVASPPDGGDVRLMPENPGVSNTGAHREKWHETEEPGAAGMGLVVPEAAPMGPPNSAGMAHGDVLAAPDAEPTGDATRTPPAPPAEKRRSGSVRHAGLNLPDLLPSSAKEVGATGLEEATPGQPRVQMENHVPQSANLSGVATATNGIFKPAGTEPKIALSAWPRGLVPVLPRAEPDGSASLPERNAGAPQTTIPDRMPTGIGAVSASRPDASDAEAPGNPAAANPSLRLVTPGERAGVFVPASVPPGHDVSVPDAGDDAQVSAPPVKTDAPLTGPSVALPHTGAPQAMEGRAKAVTGQTSEASVVMVDETAELAPGGTESVRVSPVHTFGQTVSGAPDLARGIAVQIAQTVHRAGDRSVELTLQPEELGRVRISMSAEHGALTVALQVDRPETLDVIRRHIDMFAEELRRLGHGSVAFSFQHGSTGSGGQQPRLPPAREAADPAYTSDSPSSAAGKHAQPRTPNTGVDIRL